MKAHLRRALDMNIVINLDNEVEMELVDELLQEQQFRNQDRVIGLRINPTFDHHLNLDTNTNAPFFVKKKKRRSDAHYSVIFIAFQNVWTESHLP